ncbi:MAG: hypothetical protein IJD60_07590 [Clostridia bacterium]|nr:hypothetical protein [Clostridia bacterium]
MSGGVQIRVRNKNGEDIETVYDGRNGTGEGGGGFDYRIGRGLKVTDGDTLEVDTADVVEEDNTLPITSAAVYETVGNINALLATI